MQYDGVLNPKDGTIYPYKEMEAPSPEEYEEMYAKHVPQGKYMTPYVDEVTVFLYQSPKVLNTIQHYLRTYHTLTPVFLQGKRRFPSEFALAQLINPVLESIQRPGDELPNWKWIVRQALLKLSGKFYMSAGVN